MEPDVLVARCYEVQAALTGREVPEFEGLTEVGMAVRLSLHLRGLPAVDYETLKLVASHFLDIPRLALRRILRLLAEIEFVRLQTEGTTVRIVIPTVPYYEELYEGLGAYVSAETRFNEAEQLTLSLVNRLARSPEQRHRLFAESGAEKRLFERTLHIGTEGTFLVERRCRGRTILLYPTYFAENPEIFADHVAAVGANSVGSTLEKVGRAQGWPLALAESEARIGEEELAPDQVALLRRLAQDGMIKPPRIDTSYAGSNHFMFTPTPGVAGLSARRRDVYERAMAIVAAVRQGQLLPKRFAIRDPGAVLFTLKTELGLGRATTEAREQYRNLVHLRIGKLIPAGGGFFEFRIVDTPENREALDIAYDLVVGGEFSGWQVDEEARSALQQDQQYVESLIAGAEIRRREAIKLDPQAVEELDLLLLRAGDVG